MPNLALVYAARDGTRSILIAYNMTGGRFGVGLMRPDKHSYFQFLCSVPLHPSVAADLFPGMIATGRIYSDLVIDEIEEVNHVG